MADWKAEFMAALDARDAVEKADLEFYEACTVLPLHERIEADSFQTRVWQIERYK